MTQSVSFPKGWFLAMPYMQGERGIVVSRVAHIPQELRNCPHVFCGQVLLDSIDWRDYLKDWFNALADGGRLCLWIPDARYITPQEGQQRIILEEILHIFYKRLISFMIREAEVIDGHCFVVIEKTHDSSLTDQRWKKKEKHALVMRTGAHGDALMASSILPALKAEGWTITMLVRQAGYDVLRHDPHIDEFLRLAANQLTDAELPAFWAAWAPRFDRVINLTGTVEGELLKQPHRGDYWWSVEQRRAMCAGSYLRRTHQAASVRSPYRVKFYPDDAEKNWAEKTADNLGKFVLWSLQGSSVHKWWPYTPQAICQLLARTDYQFVLTADQGALDLEKQILDAVAEYFGDTSRIHSLVNVKPVRHVMALAQRAAVVIGSETGVLNAVCLENMPKIVMLSHSAASNLTDDWMNTTALAPTSACYPCHRLHHGHEHCPQDKVTGAAMCAASIAIKRVVDAVLGLESKEKAA